jgi:RNA polymerase sigma-70 factor (ECF subfamily)
LLEPDENEIVSGVVAGSPDAWEALYRRLYPKLSSYMLRKVGPDYAEDAVSVTMARAVKGIGRYRPGPSGIDGWVFGIARRTAADHHRKRIRYQRQDGTAAAMESPPSSTAVEEPVTHAEDRIELRRAFEKLPHRERELLELRVVAELSVEQVAAALGKRPGAIRTAQTRALQKLRRLMESESG